MPKKKDDRPEIQEEQDAQTAYKQTAAAQTPAELPDPAPEDKPHESDAPVGQDVAAAVETALVADLDAAIAKAEADLAALRVQRAEPVDHTTIHGTNCIVDEERAYNIWRDGQRYVHVGEYNGQWVYRLD